MIRLDVQDYCQYCPDFEPAIMWSPFRFSATDTIVACKHNKRCETISQHLKKDYGRCKDCAHRTAYDGWNRNRGESYKAYECRVLNCDLGFDGYCSSFVRKKDTEVER